MSASTNKKPISAKKIMGMKGQEPIVCLAAYTTPIARMANVHCDLILVGDSVGMVLHGLPSTQGVSVDMMVMHGQAVRRGADLALVVVDLPFGSYEASPEQAFETASYIMAQTDCSAIKLEGGAHMAPTIQFLVDRGIPVMAHVGLTPQSVKGIGGYAVQGRGEDRQRVLDDATAVQDAGAFAVVLEMVTEELAIEATKALHIPTIGIGASNQCDGQVLVVDDMLGMFQDFKPKFVKRFAQLGEAAETAIATYADEVRTRQFPGDDHIYADKK
ncbi:3-methyl-2-oxobutanoate hydroxymethyltransferase [Maritalea sp.]|uniref:3-methyl-2-oxobutanoate hydroxymethyltransferase n=1 Tax=Maritalea sp. TaxID=2003361 RepID=UPI003EF64E66